MITRNYIKIYKISHSKLTEPELVVAKDINDAIYKFNKFYNTDIDIYPDDITGIELDRILEVIDDSEKYEN
jgi:hypothetical protein